MFLMVLNLDDQNSKDSKMIYFIVQSAGSVLLIFSFFMILDQNLILVSEMLFFLSLLLKLGFPPFHLWFVEMMCLISWNNFFLASVAQKFLPLVLLLLMWKQSMMIFFILLGCGVGLIGMLLSHLTKKIFSYSSIHATSWALSGMNYLESLQYLILYGVVLSLLVFSFDKSSIEMSLTGLTALKTNLSKSMVFLSLMGMAGMPPLVGFFAKLSILLSLIGNGFVFIASFLLFSAPFSMWVYAKIGQNLLSDAGSVFKFFNLKITSSGLILFFALIFLMVLML